MTDLTREQIEEVREMPAYGYNDRKVRALCDMALRTLDAEARIRELEAAQERDIRNYRETILKLIAEYIGLATEPHQTYWERMMEAVDLRSRAEKAEARIRELKGANERLRTAANVGRDRIENMAQLESDYGESEELFECVAQIDACIAAAPPDSGSADEVLDE